MPIIIGCLPPIPPPPISRQSVPTQVRAAGLSSQHTEKSRSYQFTQRHSEAPSRIFPQTKPNARLFQDSLRSYPSPIRKPVLPKARQSPPAYGSPVQKQALPKPQQSPRAYSRPVETQAQSKLEKFSRSDSSPVKAQARPKPSLRSTPVTTPARQTATRTLYNDKDAQRDLSSLTDSANLLTASKQFNRKRMSKAQIENVEDIGKDIKTLMQTIKKTDPTSLDTSAFRKQTIKLKSRVENHLRDISTTQVRRTPPRPAVRKAPQPQTAVAIDRQARDVARRKQLATLRKQNWQQLVASGASRTHYTDWGTPISEAAEEKTNASTLANLRDSLDDLREFFDDDDPRQIPSTVDASNPNTGNISENSDGNPSPAISPEPEKTNASPHDYARETLAALIELFDDRDPSTAGESDLDIDYVSSNSDGSLSPPISPESTKQVAPSAPWKGQASSPFRSLPTPNQDPNATFRAVIEDFLTRLLIRP